MPPKPVCRLHSYQTFQSWLVHPSQTSTENYRKQRSYKTDCKCIMLCNHGFSLWIKTNAFYPPRQRIHSNGCWFFETSVKQNLLLGSVEVGNRNGFSAEVRPVKVLVDPVHRNPHRGLDIVYYFVMYANFSSFVQYSPASKKWVSPKCHDWNQHSRVPYCEILTTILFSKSNYSPNLFRQK